MKPLYTKRQQGVVLIALFLVLFAIAATVMLSALNVRGVTRDLSRNQQLADAKQALIAFAMSVPDLYNMGPGRLPCPDTDNDGEPNSPCAANTPGRLPALVTLTAPSTFVISPIAAGTDQQFWYAVSPAYKMNPAQILNANSIGQLTLDTANDIVAVIIDADTTLAGQTRPNNLAANYLEDSNAVGTNFISTLAANPALLNDRIISIRRLELMSVMTPKVVMDIKRVLDAGFVANGNSYPANQAAFEAAIVADAGWLAANQWHSTAAYSFLTANSATVQFLGCQIVFTVTNAPASIESNPNRC
ncbi:MAG: hypothetical protein Q8L06_01620 [Pseudohongiella sp.]|nr:hypothetical protein [Pseudohongiella sp.]